MWDFIGPLVGVIIGGLVTYLTTRQVEYAKWRWEKADRHKQDLREAIGEALNWVNPITNAVTTATMIANSLAQGRQTRDDITRDWPNLIGELARRELIPRQSALLPDEFYSRGLEIARKVEELKFLMLGTQPTPETDREQFDRYVHNYAILLDLCSELNTMAESYRRDLQDAYRETYQ